MTILQMMNRDGHPCPDCGIGVMKDQLIKYSFCYDHEKLPVEHMALVCQNPNCMLICTDYRGEQARTKAIKYYLTHEKASPIQGANDPPIRQHTSNQDSEGNTEVKPEPM